MEWYEKLIASILLEIVYAFIFIIVIIGIASLPDPLSINEKIISSLVTGWVLLGIATPIAIWTEIFNHIRLK